LLGFIFFGLVYVVIHFVLLQALDGQCLHSLPSVHYDDKLKRNHTSHSSNSDLSGFSKKGKEHGKRLK
jgi:hypothetical protein